jgi:hypothetical protein
MSDRNREQRPGRKNRTGYHHPASAEAQRQISRNTRCQRDSERCAKADAADLPRRKMVMFPKDKGWKQEKNGESHSVTKNDPKCGNVPTGF